MSGEPRGWEGPVSMLTGKVCVINGAASMIGRAVAERFAGETIPASSPPPRCRWTAASPKRSPSPENQLHPWRCSSGRRRMSDPSGSLRRMISRAHDDQPAPAPDPFTPQRCACGHPVYFPGKRLCCVRSCWFRRGGMLGCGMVVERRICRPWSGSPPAKPACHAQQTCH